jgi:hypothetical protein
MVGFCTIKDLTHQAINLLEVAYCGRRLDKSRLSLVATDSPISLVAQHHELMTFCASREKVTALLLANLVAQLALKKSVSTLLVTATWSPAVFVVNLMLWRAGSDVEEVINPVWSETEFARLTVAAGEIARAPLLVAKSASRQTFGKTQFASMHRIGIRYLVLDRDAVESPLELSKLSSEFGVSIIAMTASI